MYTYTDETGHSGKNIFDKNQVFRLGSILSVKDIRPDCESVIKPFIVGKGVDRLHANNWQEHEIAKLGHDLLDALDDGNTWVFNIMQIHKPYVAPTKLVDLIFDPGENKSVPGGWYWDEMHRHILCLMIDDALTPALSESFWKAYLADDMDGIISVLDDVEEKVFAASYPSPFKRVVKSAFAFARKAPESFTLNATHRRKGYQAHSPNVIAFTQLFQAIHEFAKNTGSRPEILFHDKQDEFRKELQDTYRMFGGIIVEGSGDGKWPDASLAAYELGDLHITPSMTNFGLQATDLLLWVNQRDSKSVNIISLKERLREFETPHYIGKGMSKLIVEVLMAKRSQ